MRDGTFDQIIEKTLKHAVVCNGNFCIRYKSRPQTFIFTWRIGSRVYLARVEIKQETNVLSQYCNPILLERYTWLTKRLAINDIF